MKIALFTNQFPGKVSTFFSRDVINLLDHGFDVDIFTIYPIKEENWVYVPEQYRQRIQRAVNIKFLKPVWFKVNFSFVKTDIKNILRDSMRFGARQFIKSLVAINQGLSFAEWNKTPYDSIISYWGNYASTCAFIANKTSSNQVPFYMFLHAGTDLYRDQIYLLEKIQNAQKVITVCEFNKKFIQNLYPGSFESIREKMVLYHLGVEIPETDLSGRDENTLLCVGSLDKVKGFHLVIQALAVLVSEFPDLNLVIVGGGAGKVNLEKIAKARKISNKVTFTGQLAYSEVVKYFRSATILIHPSIGLGDAVPTVIKEAIAFGLPVVGSNEVGIPELLDFGLAGVLFNSGDLNNLIQELRALLTNRSRLKDLSLAGREYAKKTFDMRKNGHQLLIDLGFIS